MGFRKIGRVEEIPPGETKYVCLDQVPVIVANWKGQFFALSGTCPHKHYPLEGARLWDQLLDCPWHHFQYDVRTGENYFPKNVYPEDYPRLRSQLQPLKTYPVEIKEGEIWVKVE